MKKFLRNQKGFSMIELLVALLIMAVIAGIAIGIFSNIVGKTKKSADEESASQIKKQILLYMNEANDPDLSCILANESGATGTITDADSLVDRLGGITVITESGVDVLYKGSTNVKGVTTTVANWNGKALAGESTGDYGPYIDGTKKLRPQAAGNLHWEIHVNTKNQQIDVTTTSAAISAVDIIK